MSTSKEEKGIQREDPEKYSGDDASSSDDGDEPDESLIRQMLQMKLCKGEKKANPKVLEELSFDGIVRYIRGGNAKRIVTLAGAGISTSAGIPDFRTPGSGLYDNLQKYDLPTPQSIFEIDFFRENPTPFFKLAKELYPGSFSPTPSHYFIKLLEKKGILLRHYTQNIDTLERVAGISSDKLVEAHGTFHMAHCIGCKKEYSQEWVKDYIFDDGIPTCADCNSLVKPDIVFFGENLPKRFFECAKSDFHSCDLLIVMGTSLTVQPFASLVDRVNQTCPRLLINMTKTGEGHGNTLLAQLGLGSMGMDFESEDAYRDVAKLGTCDDGCVELAEMLGWKVDLDALIAGSEETSCKIDKNPEENQNRVLHEKSVIDQ